MTIIIGVILLVLTGLIVAAVIVIFALLKRLDATNSALMASADRTLAMAEAQVKVAPKQLDKMMDTLARATTQMHAGMQAAIKTVLTPPPIQVIDGAPNQQFRMPTMEEGKEKAPWDPFDQLIPDPPQDGPYAAMGYDGEDDVDAGNWTGIPGLADPPPEIVFGMKEAVDSGVAASVQSLVNVLGAAGHGTRP